MTRQSRPNQSTHRSIWRKSVHSIESCVLHLHIDNKAFPTVFEVTNMTGPVILGRTQVKAMGYIQFPQIEQPHAFTTFPNTSRKLCTHKTLMPKTILHDKTHISRRTEPQVSLHKTEHTEKTQTKQSRQTAEPVLPHRETEVQHDGRLLTLLETARMNNFSLNPDKVQFKSTDCKFFGHRLTPERLKLDPEKIKAIISMRPLQSIQQLQSFNGMVNYLKRFSPILSELTEPLRKLQKSDTVWAWESKQQTAFEKTKTALTTLSVLAYFNKDKDHIIQTDASKTGLGAVLLQEGQPIVYASRTLTDTECRYSNIERELLGVEL